MMLMRSFHSHVPLLNCKSSSPPQHTRRLKLKETAAKPWLYELWPKLAYNLEFIMNQPGQIQKYLFDYYFEG